MFYTLLTSIGKAKLANATALGTTVQLTHIAVGDGNGAAITPVDTATVLTHEVWRAALNSIAVDPANANWIVAEGYIPSTSGGFTVREVGLFDIDGDLIAIGNYPDTYKPTLAAGSAKDLYIKVIIEVTNSSTVTLKIDPAVVLSTRSYVDSKVVEHEGKADPHSQYLTVAKINSAIAEDPGDTDLFGYYDSFTGLLRKLSFNSLFTWIKIKLDPIYTTPAGTINYFAKNTAPAGYLKANGSGISRITYSELFAAICPTYGNVTSISNGIGAIVTTPTAHGRVLNDPITFTTSGALPNGLVAGTTYYVSGTVTSTTFQLSATIGGALITTSSAGVGTHTLIYVPFGTSPGGTTTFLLPDLRGEFIRSWDDSRGIDSSRVFGSLQIDSFKAHTHTVTAGGSYLFAVNGGGSAGSATSGSTSSSVGGTETRPRNIALLACIKY